MEQIWGFGMLNDERWLMRTMVVRKGNEVPLPEPFITGREKRMANTGLLSAEAVNE